MANNTLNIRIQLRNDTAENWTTKNPVLLKGEMGVEIDTGKSKIGDGSKAWTDLKYSGVDEETIKGIIDTNRGNITVVDTEASAGKDDTAILGSIEGKKDDKVIIERAITDDKNSCTAYIHNGTAWTAMDGNYNADNVYFDEDITYTVAIGTLAKPSGSAKFSAKGKNVKQVFSSLMAQEANPSKSNPAVTLSVTNEGTYEIGTKKNLSYTASMSAGSYTYGPATGITPTSWKISCTGFATGSEKTTATGTWENVVAESSPKYVTAVATYGDGAIPVTNLGNPYPAGQIKAGSANKSSNGIKGVRYMFWGPMTTDAELNSANIRGLAHNKATGTGALSTFGAGAGAKKVVVAVPAGRTITKVLMPSALNADVTALFVKQGSQVQVAGAQDYASAAYDVYVYQPASIDAGETYTVTIG